MNLFITYDYELFFGQPTGTVENCIIKPTQAIMNIAKKHQVQMVFFVDVGYLKQLEVYRRQFSQVQEEYQKITQQIKDLVAQGHDCQLHIHPHWEDVTHDGIQWQMNVNRYKLVDFEEEKIIEIVSEYKQILESLTQKPVVAYRAGGWCLQPFSKIKKAFLKAGLLYDSTVFPGGKNTKGNYFYDFTSVPNKDAWRFSDDLCVENPNGEFLEFPISNWTYSALFFWRLFVWGRLDPKNHKPMGDGYPMPSPGMKKQMLTKGMTLSASVDGYFVTKLNQVVQKNQKKGWKQTVIIGHPKAATHFALKQLDQFIENQLRKGNSFKTFSQLSN